MSHQVGLNAAVPPSPHDRLERARCSLEGLSVGDAFGQRFFMDPDDVERYVAERSVPIVDWRLGDGTEPHPVWQYTDDTMMALSVFSSLAHDGCIDQDRLAASFAEHYDFGRGYGPAMHRFLMRLAEGADWRSEAAALFGGQGSFGNGAAMRVALIGAYFAEDMDAVIEQARLSALVTHAHPEGVVGAIAVAVAAALAWRLRTEDSVPRDRDFLDLVLPFVPDSMVREKIRHARNLAPGCSVRLAISALGNGIGMSAQDTVPFALWCAARHLNDYSEALFLAVSGLGDSDTNCAIVGGIVAAFAGMGGIPPEWLASRETLPEWPFEGH